jgi:hypothetical protein
VKQISILRGEIQGFGSRIAKGEKIPILDIFFLAHRVCQNNFYQAAALRCTSFVSRRQLLAFPFVLGFLGR